MNYIVMAIPVFLSFILFELIANWYKKKDYYHVNDSINSITAGIISQLTGILIAIIPIKIYIYIYNNYAFSQDNADNIIVWIIGFILYDFCYYWYHRMSHEINLLWASHVVHHQSEEFNFSTALRQTSTAAWFAWLFYIPMAIIGIDPIIAGTVASLNLIYQFFVHTRFIGKLHPWVEAIMVTPSQHGVHHAQNSIYIDRNYGGVFSLWDRFFGTFQEELDKEKPVYGVRKALATWNPVWANFDTYYCLIQDSWHTTKWADKIKVWVKFTGWRPDDVKKSHPRKYTNPKNLIKFDVSLSSSGIAYVILQHLIVLALAIWFLLIAKDFSTVQKAVIYILILLSVVSISKAQENKASAFISEFIRLLCTAGFLLFTSQSVWLSGLTILLLIISLCLLKIFSNTLAPKNIGQSNSSA